MGDKPEAIKEPAEQISCVLQTLSFARLDKVGCCADSTAIEASANLRRACLGSCAGTHP